MLKLSNHVVREMEKRGIVLAYIEAALAAPDRVMVDPTDADLTRSYKAIAGFGNRILRVVHRPEGGADTFIITAHWDRGARL